jgi:hypothetical protein
MMGHAHASAPSKVAGISGLAPLRLASGQILKLMLIRHLLLWLLLLLQVLR